MSGERCAIVSKVFFLMLLSEILLVWITKKSIKVLNLPFQMKMYKYIGVFIIYKLLFRLIKYLSDVCVGKNNSQQQNMSDAFVVRSSHEKTLVMCSEGCGKMKFSQMLLCIVMMVRSSKFTELF